MSFFLKQTSNEYDSHITTWVTSLWSYAMLKMYKLSTGVKG